MDTNQLWRLWRLEREGGFQKSERVTNSDSQTVREEATELNLILPVKTQNLVPESLNLTVLSYLWGFKHLTMDRMHTQFEVWRGNLMSLRPKKKDL